MSQARSKTIGDITTSSEIAYFTTKDFDKSLKSAQLSGGLAQRKALSVRQVLGSLRDANPFATLTVTNHGESRIRHCVKYDLGNGWRLVTVNTDKTCGFLFMGDHESTDAWLHSHRGQVFAVRDGKATLVPGVGASIDYSHFGRADHHDKPLVDLLPQDAMDHVLVGVPRSVARRIETLDGRASSTDLKEIVGQIDDPERSDLIHSVFNLLLAGDHDGAQARIDLSRGIIKPVEMCDTQETIEIEDGESIRRLRIGSLEYERWLANFEKVSPWYEWFLYLHPEQERIVRADFDGSAQLSGVSGSGKTCVCVRRALRLAEKSEVRVLVLTLNRSLAGLLDQLVNAVSPDKSVRNRIEVSSFFQLAQSLLLKFEPENRRQYEDVTWKLNEHVDEVFREYYRQWTNNRDAAVLVRLHKSLISRGVCGETYIREEFDWIRSAVLPTAWDSYLALERKGRKLPIPPEGRKELLAGLTGWEKKMTDVGVIDYLGLTSALSLYIDRLQPIYTHIIVDEAQDFGTTELRVVRALVPRGPNDVFLCGDVAQTILPKHRSLSEAQLTDFTRSQIRQNYRNSREILIAAYDVLKNNLSEDLFESEDLEILDPKFANFSGSVPMALCCDSLEKEITYARAYASTALAQGAKTVCIAFAGFSARDVKNYATSCGVTALDGTYDPSTDNLVFCDLEQTKGYEFDTLIIVQCKDGVLPPADVPQEECFRASCKLYVAMTRAKRELILSFHDAASPWIAAVTGSIEVANWDEFENLDPHALSGAPEKLPELEQGKDLIHQYACNGMQYVYTHEALGLSVEAQDKLIELVNGRGLLAASAKARLKWRDMRSFMSDLEDGRVAGHLLGSNVAKELRSHFQKGP